MLFHFANRKVGNYEKCTDVNLFEIIWINIQNVLLINAVEIILWYFKHFSFAMVFRLTNMKESLNTEDVV